MNTLSVRLPNSLHRHLHELAAREGVSMNQLISSAVGEKLAALMTQDDLARASRGRRRLYEGVLRKVPDLPADESDKRSKNRIQRMRPAQGKPRR
jgi:predicted transcriptional regulator